jgi:integrase
MIVARWSGARRSEVRRLTTDWLDSYPDGTARLRIPVGKTARERMIPLHDEAADGLRAVLAIRADGADRRLPDERTGELVRSVFVWHGKLMSDRHLFGTPLECLRDSGPGRFRGQADDHDATLTGDGNALIA